MTIKELITNADGRLSTTGTIQFFGFVACLGILLYCVYLDKNYVPELFSTFLWCCVGGTATKGAVSVFRSNRNNSNSRFKQEQFDD